jgi:hypothetical protein
MGIGISIAAFVFLTIFAAIGYFKEIPATGKLSKSTISMLIVFSLAMILGILDISLKEDNSKQDKRDIMDTTKQTGQSIKASVAKAQMDLSKGVDSNTDRSIKASKMGFENLAETVRKYKAVAFQINNPNVDLAPSEVSRPNPYITKTGKIDSFLINYIIQNIGGDARDFKAGSVAICIKHSKDTLNTYASFGEIPEKLINGKPGYHYVHNFEVPGGLENGDVIFFSFAISFLNAKGVRQPTVTIMRMLSNQKFDDELHILYGIERKKIEDYIKRKKLLNLNVD